ncbi:MAG: segregation/condensation protein A [Candidatus Diapherotrites archaeon]|uniref:Segregation/condensation protein A n=1 Tax=Candidatus Iainarchaeum sp. TaxID=3101447 RepID=A0A938YS19_9ARCH|nr:segregation/condensation protein A [Candidatus Diapherotrites archaeon]
MEEGQIPEIGEQPAQTGPLEQPKGEKPGPEEQPAKGKTEPPAGPELENVNLVDLIEQPAWKTILIGLVKSEKMDPWDIDIVDLANKYWEKIQNMQRADLRIPANAILASAILLKLKARTIRLSSLDEDEEETKEVSREELAMIEESLPELKGQRQFREGKISLDELVVSIEKILEKTKQRKSILREKDLPEFKFFLNEENIDGKIENVFAKIRERADSQGLVAFTALLDERTPMAMINCFVPLLFLVNQGKVNAWQDEWFGEIFISLIEGGEENREREGPGKGESREEKEPEGKKGRAKK